MNYLADLHSHTNFSDGKLTPFELLTKAEKIGLSAISITDHDTVEGVKVALDFQGQFKTEVLPGIEISSHLGKQELHLLGYNIDVYNSKLNEFTDRFKKSREERGKQIIKKLNAIGKDISLEEVLINAKKAPITRPHIANLLVSKGYAFSIKDAFNKYLMEGRPAYVPKEIFPVDEAIKLVAEVGGISVLAHPSHYVNQYMLSKLIEMSLDGIEVIHPSHNFEMQKYYHSIANQFWLIETGGSDYHGTRDYDEDNFGKFTVSYKTVELIKKQSVSRNSFNP